MILKYGVTYAPASLNIIAKRIGITESEKNLDTLRAELEKLVRKKKIFKSGNRYAIDVEGAKAIALQAEKIQTLPTPENFKKTFKHFLISR